MGLLSDMMSEVLYKEKEVKEIKTYDVGFIPEDFLNQNRAGNLVLSHCGICRAELRDARSVEMGIGPVCIKKFLEDIDQLSEKAREATNSVLRYLSHLASRNQFTMENIIHCLDWLLENGFTNVWAGIMREFAVLRIKKDRYSNIEGYCIRGEALKNGHAFRFDIERMLRNNKHRFAVVHGGVFFSEEAKKDVFNLMEKHFSGEFGYDMDQDGQDSIFRM